ncbi:NDUFA12-domain-containing protein [Neolentinus lepideus HHB14362 ss-1]|uniref:NADH dehydrogenase [ubiquinone] 1 alpha subcomplex subunit n=1 Tax=Neolentinus lepideus HHB14362 ss-1 TaxID=1314782 RepID=A0A165TQL0_9AGAM|nr:NDUFA12-domain-containing protein [Neolentinus lepideus HHB14362 ss-1]
MVSIGRYIRNIQRSGVKKWIRDMWYIGDAKYGKCVGQDQFGNKYYENLNPEDELPGRHRWVDYSQHNYHASQVPPEWHSWLHHIRNKPPPEDTVMQNLSPPWKGAWVENLTGTRGAYKSYNTAAAKINPWEPKAAPRNSA